LLCVLSILIYVLVGESLFFRRELSFTLENDTYIRYKSFHNAAEMRTAMTKTLPFKIDIGAVFSVSPADKNKVNANDFVPEQRELVFDIDLTDYDDIRTCCDGASICAKCWRFMVAAVKVMDVALRDDFGFRHIMWVYSGRRGIHCWVSDELARSLTNEARTAVVQYLSVVEGNENAKRKVHLKEPMHPSLDRAYRILEPLFDEIILSEDGQGVLSEEKHWTKVLDMVPDDDLRSHLASKWASPSCGLSPREKWAELVQGVDKIIAKAAPNNKRLSQSNGDQRKRNLYELRTCIQEIVLSYLYPRLDANVSKQRNHLLKSPFAVHPKTGRVCVPVNAAAVEEFDPFTVPTLGQLQDELNNNTTKEGSGTCIHCDLMGRSCSQHLTGFDSQTWSARR
jgi:DNA primase small subunit